MCPCWRMWVQLQGYSLQNGVLQQTSLYVVTSYQGFYCLITLNTHTYKIVFYLVNQVCVRNFVNYLENLSPTEIQPWTLTHCSNQYDLFPIGCGHSKSLIECWFHTTKANVRDILAASVIFQNHGNVGIMWSHLLRAYRGDRCCLPHSGKAKCASSSLPNLPLDVHSS